jgi:hypothetical protein
MCLKLYVLKGVVPTGASCFIPLPKCLHIFYAELAFDGTAALACSFCSFAYSAAQYFIH